MVKKEFRNQRRKQSSFTLLLSASKIYHASAVLLWFLLPILTRSNQSQEIRSRNWIEKEEEKQDENPNHSKRGVKIQGYQKIKDKDFQREDDQFQIESIS